MSLWKLNDVLLEGFFWHQSDLEATITCDAVQHLIDSALARL